MDQYPFDDENVVHLEMHLPGIPESQGLVCSKALNHDLCLNVKDVMYTGLSGLDVVPDLLASDALEADLNALSLYPVKDCDPPQLLHEPDLQPSQHEPGLPMLMGPEEAGGGEGGSRSLRGEKRPIGSPQTSPLGCSHCGKVFGSASALSKHCLTHSQKREYICLLCSKAFKRSDHLSGHMLTHQKIKPFVCPEQECDKSYCNRHSLLRHYKLKHGLCGSEETPKEGTGEESLLLPSLYSQGSGKSEDRLTARSDSGPFPPERDLLRCVVSSFANRKLPLAALPSAEHAAAALTDSSPASQASCLTPNSSELQEAATDGLVKDCLLCQGSVASPDVCAVTNPSNVSAIALGEMVVTNLAGRSLISEAQLPSEPTGLQRCPNSALPCFPAFEGQRPSANQSSGNFQWIRNVPVCAKPKRNSVCLAHKPPVMAPDVSEGLAGPSRTFSAMYEGPDALSFPVVPFKAEEDVPSESALGCFEETFPLVKPHCSHPWENAGELSVPEVQNLSVLRSETRQLFPKPLEPAACPEPLHLFQTITKAQQVFSHAQALAPSLPMASEAKHLTANPLQTGFWQPPPLVPQLMEYGGPSTYPPKPVPQLVGERPAFGPSGAAPLSPVAMTSFSSAPAGGGTRRLTIFNRIQVTEKESPDGKDLKENLHQKKREWQTRPRSLFVAPPLAPGGPLGMGGCYRSNLRLQTFRVDDLLRDLFQNSPYTPPPMLSPIREGSGLYFSTLCASSAHGDPNQLFGAVLGRIDRDFGFCVMKGRTKIHIEPHINVGSQFQAEIPDLQDRSHLEKEEERALLVWKPWGDIETNPETQDRVTELLNTACSSAMPGGGTNIELALHCLHETEGNVVEALKVLVEGPQKSESHPLADYHYTGSDIWTPLEEELFAEAFRVHKKNFHLIQKKIQTKTVSQCVEYYYMWKKKNKFKCRQARVERRKKGKRRKDEVEESEEQGQCFHPILIVELKHFFGYLEFICDNVFLYWIVFNKINRRNAHMKRHHQQEQVPPLLKFTWPVKHFKNEAKMEETQMVTSSTVNGETVIPE
ncbi:PREDICTED: zinc finger protein 541 [Cariama cristata]|nr:PREDICTED: zinc finger protein 541 [Cariama cristata]